MAQKGSTQFVPPPISHLLKYPVQDDINIEEGLCKPENESLFLISSIAFLQKQLMKKLETHDADSSENAVGRKYSDLLIVESGQKYMRQKKFIRLPNIDKFDEVLKNEASLPQNVLSNTQLLPLPKKSKSPKLTMPNIFKPKSSVSIPSSTTKKTSLSVFSLFKKNPSNGVSTALEVGKPLSNYIEFDTEKIVVITENERRCEEQVSPIRSSSSVSIGKSASTLTVNENGDSDSTIGSTGKRVRTLSEAEEEILRIIPKESNLAIKKSINEKLRSTRKSPSSIAEDEDTGCSSEVSLVKKEDDFYEDPETGIKFKCMPMNPVIPRRLKEQQSKLSVCIEEETESEIDYGQEQRKYPFNCTDDVKALVSSEAIDLIINEVWQKLDPDSK